MMKNRQFRHFRILPNLLALFCVFRAGNHSRINAKIQVQGPSRRPGLLHTDRLGGPHGILRAALRVEPPTLRVLEKSLRKDLGRVPRV